MLKHTAHIFLVVFLIVLGLFSTSAAAHATTSIIDDEAKVLGDGKAEIEAATAKAPFKTIILMRDHMWSSDNLDKLVETRTITEGDNTIVIGVDVKLKHMHVAWNKAYIKQADGDAAIEAMKPAFSKGEWAQGLVIGIDKLTVASNTNRTPQSVQPAALHNEQLNSFGYAIGVILGWLFYIFLFKGM